MGTAHAPDPCEAATAARVPHAPHPRLAPTPLDQIQERIRLGHYDRPDVLDAIIDAIITQALHDR